MTLEAVDSIMKWNQPIQGIGQYLYFETWQLVRVNLCINKRFAIIMNLIIIKH